MDLCKEAFKKGYRVTRDGEVIGLKKSSLSLVMGAKGYWYITVYIKGAVGQKRKNLDVHRLVAYQKYGDRLLHPGIEVRHLDGNKTNNSWDNIAIGTHSENLMDVSPKQRIERAVKAGRSNSKLTPEDVLEIKRLREDDQLSYNNILSLYPMSKSTLSYIINKKTWNNV